MADELSGNIIAELIKRGIFGGFIEVRMQSLLEVMWNKLEHELKYSQKAADQLEEYSDSKGMQSVLNGRTFKYHFWGGRFHMLTNTYKFSHGLCLNNFSQLLLIVNQRYQVPPFRYINQADELSHLVRGSLVLGDMKY